MHMERAVQTAVQLHEGPSRRAPWNSISKPTQWGGYLKRATSSSSTRSRWT